MVSPCGRGTWPRRLESGVPPRDSCIMNSFDWKTKGSTKVFSQKVFSRLARCDRTYLQENVSVAIVLYRDICLSP